TIDRRSSERHSHTLAVSRRPLMPLDLNETDDQKSDLPHFDLGDLKRKLADRAPEIYTRLFPLGRISSDGRELRMANTRGDAPRGEGSCVIELYGAHAGCIRAWSTDEYGDQLDTLSYATGLEGRVLYEHAAKLVGAVPAKPQRNGKANGHANGNAPEITFILLGCQPATDTK